MTRSLLIFFSPQVYDDFVKIDSMLSLAICIDSDANIVWKKRDPEDIMYNNHLLDTDLLFPARMEPLDEDFAQNIKQEIEEDAKRG